MAAYAALLSLKQTIEVIQHHPRPPIFLDKKVVESLIENVNFLQDFLEDYACVGSHREAVDLLERRIAEAAHAAEDTIETLVVDGILAGPKPISLVDFYQGLEKVIQDMAFIFNDVIDLTEKNIGTGDHLRRNSSTLGGAGSPRSPLTTKQDTMVGFDDLLIEVMDKLIGQQYPRIIPIVGMGGIGKTTLARNAFTNPLITIHFDICAWVTISQNYNVQEILIEILLCISKDESREIFSTKSEGELGEIVHKSLWGRRYLIVMDDIWSVDVWDKVHFFFPDNGKGSRIMITTRLSNVASIGSHGLVMNFLDEEKSWELLCKNVFEKEEDCRVELEEIGKKIAKNCKGLPLSIAVIGGLLANSEHTSEHWEYILENLNSIVNAEDNERCLKVLQLSYHHLPVHLKPCFLYMGVFPEDENIRVSWLVKLWFSEGFLKPINGKSLEVVSREYLKDLCDRNLIRVHQRGSVGGIKLCNMHDLVRELCLREAEKEKFLYVLRKQTLNIPQGINTQRRIAIHQSDLGRHLLQVANTLALGSMALARSLMCKFVLLPSDPGSHCRLLRVLNTVDKDSGYYASEDSIKVIFQLVNSRFLAISSRGGLTFPSSFDLLWNLQTLIVKDTVFKIVAPSEIWKMTQLRHVQFRELVLPDPRPDGQDDDCVLENLQTLSNIRNFKCGEVKRIPNINKLKIMNGWEHGECSSLNNLGRLCKLESLFFKLWGSFPTRHDILKNLILPNSLKKLTLSRTNLYWKDMTKIGLLPNLQVLKLKNHAFDGPEWETVEGQFCNLKFLLIFVNLDLECWTTDSSHFPRLEHLMLDGLRKLEKIPSGIGDIPTLQSIRLVDCTDSAVNSAKKILEEQEELGNEGLRVQVFLRRNQEHLESLASPNFQIEHLSW